MLSIQFLIMFYMQYIIMFSLFNIERKNKIWKVNTVLTFLLLVHDIVRFYVDGYHSVREYDSTAGLITVFFSMLYGIGEYKKIINWILLVVSVFISALVSVAVMGAILIMLGIDPRVLQENPIASVIGMLVGLLSVYAINFIKNRWNIAIDFSLLTRRDILMMVMFVVMFGFYVGNIQVMVLDYEGGIRQLLNIFSLAAGLIPIFGIYHIVSQKDKINYLKLQEKQQEALFEQERQHYEQIQIRDLELKKFKHDITDELYHLETLAKNNDVENLLESLNKIQGETKRLIVPTYKKTGSDIVDSSWYNMVTNLKYKDIETKWIGKIPKNLLITNRDLLKLFANLLKNAFEAAEAGKDSKYVDVKIDTGDKLEITICNSHSNNAKQSSSVTFFSTKDNKNNRGYGTRIIKEIVDKYNGVIKYEFNDSKFEAKIIFGLSIYKR